MKKKCTICGKSGLFLKMANNYHCVECQQKLDVAQPQYEELCRLAKEADIQQGGYGRARNKAAADATLAYLDSLSAEDKQWLWRVVTANCSTWTNFYEHPIFGSMNQKKKPFEALRQNLQVLTDEEKAKADREIEAMLNW